MVKKDREIYLKSLAASGDWHKLRQLRKPKKPSQGRLMDMKGQLVSSEHRAQTMAEYLAEVQWAVRPAPLVPGRLPIFGPLPVDEGCIKFGEVIAALKHLKWNKAAGLDNIPPELWEALLHDHGACKFKSTLHRIIQEFLLIVEIMCQQFQPQLLR